MVTLQDPSKIKVYTWYNTGSQGNYINEYGTEGRSSYSTDRAKSASFRVERKDEWEISENKDITSNKNGKSKFYMTSLNFFFFDLVFIQSFPKTLLYVHNNDIHFYDHS